MGGGHKDFGESGSRDLKEIGNQKETGKSERNEPDRVPKGTRESKASWGWDR